MFISALIWSGLFTTFSVECPENLDLGLFTEQTCYILSAKIIVSEMPGRRHPRDTAGHAVSLAPKKFARTIVLILGTLGLNFAGQGCHSQKNIDGPSLELTKIPPAAQGGRERIDTIAGRVRNAHPGQQIVIYAHSGTWWVQPWPDRAFISIRADSTWSTETHLGFD
jgi:hypothetical protein